jgi:hypothetical protein
VRARTGGCGSGSSLTTFDYSKHDKMTEKYCEDNNYNNDYDKLAYPFSKRIKLKHEPEEAQENKPVQYTADIITEIKNRDGTVVPTRALLDTGTTATIILREFVGNGRARTNAKKRTKWKALGETFTTNYKSLLDFKFPELSTSKVVTWQSHVDDKTSSKEEAYDMIMGMDLMTSIGITVDCEQRCIRWDGTEIPLKTRATLIMMKFCTCYIMQQMSQTFCKKQKRDRNTYYMLITAKLR